MNDQIEKLLDKIELKLAKFATIGELLEIFKYKNKTLYGKENDEAEGNLAYIYHCIQERENNR